MAGRAMVAGRLCIMQGLPVSGNLRVKAKDKQDPPG